MTAVLVGLLLLNDRQYLFDTKTVEISDWAADSIMVREAKHSVLLHGHYSRWSFYHPGPALLDTLAVGEALFYDTLHVVPSPYNGQLLMLCLAMALFFSLALTVCANQLGKSRGGFLFFLPLALFFAVWHYSSAQGVHVFLGAWPAEPPVLAFLCLVVSAAAVASGGGLELPVLVLAGGWLVHNHVAQPLFVVPLALLAYTGLLASCRRSQGNTTAGGHGIIQFITQGWRAFPRAHWIAAVLLSLFVLPLAIDALHGGESNAARIVAHLRTHHDPGKKLLRSLCYFLTFGSYGIYQPGPGDYFGHYDAGGMLAFVKFHWRAYAFWTTTLLGTPALFFASNWYAKKQGRHAEWKAQGGFMPWFYITLGTAFILTLYWGIKQDGPMYYFNAYFNYSIYFCLALGLAAALAAVLMAWTHSPRASRARPIVAALLWVGVAGAAFHQRNNFRSNDAFGGPEDLVLARTVERAVEGFPKETVYFLDCHPWSNWPVTIAVALELERLGRRFRVNDNWEIMFGADHTIRSGPVETATPLVRWIIVPRSEDPTHLDEWPLLAGSALDIKTLPVVNPSGQLIRFSNDGNYHSFAFFGWAPSDGPWTWSEQLTAMLAFRPLPLPGSASQGIDLLISAWSFSPPDKADLQRAIIRFNGSVLDTVRLPIGPDTAPLRLRISSTQWQDAAAKGAARLQFDFPDAKSPASVGVGTDIRLLGGAFRSIEFRPASGSASVAQPVEVTPAVSLVASSEQSRTPAPASVTPPASAKAEVAQPSAETPVALLQDGRFTDNWCGAATKFMLPVDGTGPIWVRLRGRVPEEFKYQYPYRLVCQSTGGFRKEFTAEHAGSFDFAVAVPIESGAHALEIQLLAPQTFVPSQHDTRSADSRELSVHLDTLNWVTASNPLLVERETGWYDMETDGKTQWRWTNGASSLSVLAVRASTLVLEGSANAMVSGNAAEILVDDKPVTVMPLTDTEWRAVAWRLPIGAGMHHISLRSRLPVIQPPGDSRRLAFRLRDLRWRLDP